MKKPIKKIIGLGEQDIDSSAMPPLDLSQASTVDNTSRSSIKMAEDLEKKRQQQEAKNAEPDPFDQVPEGFAIKLAPLGAYVLIKPAPVKKKTGSGIHIPDNAQEQLNYGMVVAKGPGDAMSPELDMNTVNKGDTVMYGKFNGYNLNINGQMYLMIRLSDLRCILSIVPKPDWEAEQPKNKIVNMGAPAESREVAERHNMSSPQPDHISQGKSIADQEGMS